MTYIFIKAIFCFGFFCESTNARVTYFIEYLGKTFYEICDSGIVPIIILKIIKAKLYIDLFGKNSQKS
jgi:hypothetical protein